jgi:hypothetical protein
MFVSESKWELLVRKISALNRFPNEEVMVATHCSSWWLCLSAQQHSPQFCFCPSMHSTFCKENHKSIPKALFIETVITFFWRLKRFRKLNCFHVLIVSSFKRNVLPFESPKLHICLC